MNITIICQYNDGIKVFPELDVTSQHFKKMTYFFSALYLDNLLKYYYKNVVFVHCMIKYTYLCNKIAG